jgi:hypothetical protein
MSRLAPPHDLVDVAREIQQADALLGAVTSAKLELVVRQIRALQDEALCLLEAAQRDGELHRTACGFKKRPGRVYHLYRRPDGTRYFSMLSPAEWGGAPPHAFEGSYRLEVDMSWTPLHARGLCADEPREAPELSAEEIETRDAGEAAQLRQLLGPGA